MAWQWCVYTWQKRINVILRRYFRMRARVYGCKRLSECFHVHVVSLVDFSFEQLTATCICVHFSLHNFFLLFVSAFLLLCIPFRCYSVLSRQVKIAYQLISRTFEYHTGATGTLHRICQLRNCLDVSSFSCLSSFCKKKNVNFLGIVQVITLWHSDG